MGGIAHFVTKCSLYRQPPEMSTSAVVSAARFAYFCVFNRFPNFDTFAKLSIEPIHFPDYDKDAKD
jgi:hypothetical protein